MLSELIYDAHASIIATAFPDFKCPHFLRLADLKTEYPFELAKAEELRKIWMTANNLQVNGYSLKNSVLDQKDPEALRNHYGSLNDEVKKLVQFMKLKTRLNFSS